MPDQGQTPSLTDFETWTTEDLLPFTQDKTVVFAPGGTSRWYFLEHGDVRVGYGETEQFRDYSHRARRRIVEQVGLMSSDGIGTVLVVAHMPEEQTRDAAYNENLTEIYRLLIDERAQELYAEFRLHVLFRGGWRDSLELLGSADVVEQFDMLERQTARYERCMVWLAPDEDVIPRSLTPLVADSLQKTGRLPDRATLCEAYYGRPIQHVDIFLSNNKPSVKNMMPPMLTLGDLYFTVAPSLYMGQRQWRHILYDHLFARRKYYREYTKLSSEAVEDMRTFYTANQEIALGVGAFHELSQTWRPVPPVS
jgi:hypothetical protein